MTLYALFRGRRFPVRLRPPDTSVRPDGKEFLEAISGPVSLMVPVVVVGPEVERARLIGRIERAGYQNVRPGRASPRRRA